MHSEITEPSDPLQPRDGDTDTESKENTYTISVKP